MTNKKEYPVLTVDVLIEDDAGRILLIKRGVEPFKGEWCLPGGKVDLDERVEAALEREIIEEVGVRIGIRELVGIYSDPDRDPRGHYVSVVFHATIIGGHPETSEEVSDLNWVSPKDDVTLGFDHGKILDDWWQRKGEGGINHEDRTGTPKPQMRKHPVDQKVQQAEDARIENKRVVEDEAGRGKRVVETGNGPSTTGRKRL